MAQKTKNGKRFVKASGAILLTVATILGSFGLVSHNKANRISDESQVETIAESLTCDLSYMKHNSTGGVVRMMHNGDEPIYVHITDEMNEEENKLIKESLDYVFHIVGSINNNYKYELVDKEEYYKQKILGKTTIKYVEGPCISGPIDANGQISRKTNVLKNFSENDYYSRYVIEYNREGSKHHSYDEKLYVFLHELLHAFGLDDVYVDGPHKKTDIDYRNTIMKGSGNIITPNDFKCLLSAYAEKLSGGKLSEYIDKAEQVSSEYEKYYYENRIEKLRDYENDTLIDLEGKDVNSMFESTLTDVDGTILSQQVNLKIEGNRYTLEISGGGRESVCVVSGVVLEQNGVKILRNVKFTGSFELSEMGKAEETIMDLYVVRIQNRDMLYDANNYSSMWGKNLENVNELE